MQRDFKPPVNEAEFIKRADEITLDGAYSVLETLRLRKQQMIKPINAEIEFYRKVINRKENAS